MSIVLALVPLILVVGAVSTSVPLRYRPRWSDLLAPAALTLSAILWLLAGRFLPLTWVLSTGSPVALLSPWRLHVDGTIWMLSFSLLLLALAVLVPSERSAATAVPPSQYILLVAAAALLVLWSHDLAGLLLAWSLLAAAWLALLWKGGRPSDARGQLFTRLSFIALGVPFIWLAAANLRGSSGTNLDLATLPASATGWLFLAAATMMGVFPLHWWRPLNRRLPPRVAVLVHVAPAVGGAGLFARLVQTSDVSISRALLPTAVGFLGLLWGAAYTWSHLGDRLMALPGVILAQASLILLAGTWVGLDAVVAETRVMALAAGGLFLVDVEQRPAPKWQLAGRAIILAGIAGLPLTAGFNSRVALHRAWLDGGRPILSLVAGLLYASLLAAVILITGRRVQQSRPARQAAGLPSLLAVQPGVLLVVLGLLALPRVPLSMASAPSVVVVILAAAAGLMLSRNVRRLRDVREAVRSMVHINLPLHRISESLAAGFRLLGDALREAAAILEGEGGMLWLLVLMGIFWLAIGR